MVEVMRSCSAPISVGQVRLVAHCGRHTAEQGGYLGTSLGETEDVVDEQQHVLTTCTSRKYSAMVSPVSADSHTGSRRLVHLTEYQWWSSR